MPRFHGLTTPANGGKSEFHFGVRNIFDALKIAQAFPGRNKYPTLQPWSRSQIEKFVTALGKLEDTFGKLARTAELYDVARCRIVDLKGPTISVESLAATQQALRDIPLHLDCVLLYLRILADCLANLTSQLYPSDHVPFRSFRDQMKWFTRSRPEFDTQYAEMLRSHTNWFTTLAGDSKTDGLRDLIVHGMVRTELLFQAGTTPAENRVHSFLYGIAAPTVNTTRTLEASIQQIMTELCEFLDLYAIHFAAKVGAEMGCELLNWADPRSSLWFPIQGEYGAQWLFPSITTHDIAASS
ncbi:MAG TPA: hypothetical protein VMU57_19985 [Edaphobacter sp.]|uniref:hypothetical protein n=1 Tax=Edaphobacter sp. TaxID=1934404 RepID=UPI002CF5DCA3|nr:hypothetical protein [Edaphobacter sp.]HUZ97191.1 hypothetical protein [Edaphobacter sp.]